MDGHYENSPGRGRLGGGRADQGSVRRNNLGLVLQLLRERGPRSRARIADETGLTRATVSSLVAELIDRELVRDGDVERRGAVGRPGQPVELHGRGVAGIGIEVNVEYAAVRVLDLAGEAFFERRIPLVVPALHPDTVLDVLRELSDEALAGVRRRGAQTVGLTVAVPGLVNVAEGTVALAPNLGWRNLRLVEGLTARLDRPPFPVAVDNDANLAALGELAQGQVGTGDFVYLAGGVGVGLGVVTGGRLLRGAGGFSGEIGHLPLDSRASLCGCGRRGCWETVVGFAAMVRSAADEHDPVRDPSLDLQKRLDEIGRRADAGDERTLAALRQVGEGLSLGGAVLINLLNPSAVVLGGYFAALGAYLLEPMSRELRQRVIAPEAGGARLLLSRLGFSAAVQGGAQYALDNALLRPTEIIR